MSSSATCLSSPPLLLFFEEQADELEGSGLTVEDGQAIEILFFDHVIVASGFFSAPKFPSSTRTLKPEPWTRQSYQDTWYGDDDTRKMTYTLMRSGLEEAGKDKLAYSRPAEHKLWEARGKLEKDEEFLERMNDGGR